MSFIDKFFHRPPPSPEPLSRGSKGQYVQDRARYIIATREESRKARVARIHTTLQLEVAVARLSPEEKRAAVERGGTR
jgi:hypothetical protein